MLSTEDSSPPFIIIQVGEENIVGNGTLQSCCGLVVLWDNLKQWLIQPRIIIIGAATVRQYSLAHSVMQFHYWGKPKAPPSETALQRCVCMSVCLLAAKYRNF